MVRITRYIDIALPMERVWQAASDLGSHAEWMVDAESIELLSEQTSGVGARMGVLTVVGPFRTRDVIEVIEWEEGRSIGVRHTGLVRGTGRLLLAPVAGATRLTWSEQLGFPWCVGGPVAAALAKPVLALVWRRNLAELKRTLEGRG